MALIMVVPSGHFRGPGISVASQSQLAVHVPAALMTVDAGGLLAKPAGLVRRLALTLEMLPVPFNPKLL